MISEHTMNNLPGKFVKFSVSASFAVDWIGAQAKYMDLRPG
jgi:hypothetical protein